MMFGWKRSAAGPMTSSKAAAIAASPESPARARGCLTHGARQSATRTPLLCVLPGAPAQTDPTSPPVWAARQADGPHAALQAAVGARPRAPGTGRLMVKPSPSAAPASRTAPVNGQLPAWCTLTNMTDGSSKKRSLVPWRARAPCCLRSATGALA